MFLKDKKQSNFQRYIDASNDLSNKELKWGDWYVRHKQLLGQIGTGALILFALIFNVYALFGWGNYLFFGLVEDNELAKQAVASTQNYYRIQPLYKAIPLQIDDVTVFSPGPGRHDFVARVTNPNKQFMATVSYEFSFDGGKTEVKQTTLLPQEQRPVGILGHETKGFPTNARLQVVSVDWDRVNPHVIKDIEDYVDQRVQFVFSDFEFIKKSAADNIPSNMIQFDIENNSTFSYWSPMFYIELLQGSQVVGITQITIDKFLAREKRSVDLRNTLDSLSVSDIRLYPVVNIFDQNEFMDVLVTPAKTGN